MNCCKYKPSDLNRKIEFYALVDSRTGTGGQSTSWELIVSVWAKITAKQGKEISHGDQLDAVAVSEFIVRYRTDLVESTKIVYRGVDYQIRSIINIDEADEWLQIKAERGAVQ